MTTACSCCCGPYLQPDWARRSRESSRSFISLLTKQTLLTSGTGLTICTLGNNREIKSVSGTVGIQMKQMRHRLTCKVDTYSGTGCSYRSLRASGTRWTLQRRRDTSIKTREFRSKNGSTSQLTLEMNNNSHVLLCHLCFLSGQALRSLPAERKRQQCENGDGRNPRFKELLG